MEALEQSVAAAKIARDTKLKLDEGWQPTEWWCDAHRIRAAVPCCPAAHITAWKKPDDE